MVSFAGESQARNRYTYFARRAAEDRFGRVHQATIGISRGFLTSCPDDAASAKHLLDSVPIHRIFAEHMAQCPERHVELSQEKRLLDFTHDTSHEQHDENGL
jgi:hypothetical protein